jgi:Limonene-1,2-epoxide hydrolase catalytic domain
MVPSTTVDVKSIVATGGTVLTERVDNFKIDGKPIGMEVVGVFDVDANGRITRWRDYYRLADASRAGSLSNPVFHLTLTALEGLRSSATCSCSRTVTS